MFRLAVSIIVASLAATPAHAWGKKGHAVIAGLAERQLHPATQQKVRALLASEGASDLKSVASWADAIKRSRPDAPFHSARLPLRRDGFLNCNKHKMCATDAVEKYIGVLRDDAASADAQLEALKFVVHLVGDIHQPLHATQSKIGHVKVVVGNQPMILHQAWDTALLGDQSAREMELELTARASATRDSNNDPNKWAMESRDIVLNFILPQVRSGEKNTLTNEQRKESLNVIKDRIVLASVRLANILNDALR